MHKSILIQKRRSYSVPTLIAVAFAAITLSSCATKYPTQPATNTTTNTVTIDEFYTLTPNGAADDFYFLNDTEDDVDYSFFLDEQDYLAALHAANTNDNDPAYRFIIQYVKNGHGYGDHNHIHEFVKGSHHNHGVYIRPDNDEDWTDSLALTDVEKSEIDTAMISFLDCARPAIDTFAVTLAPYRDSFRVQRAAIVASMDSGTISRDSARIELDSVISTYMRETDTIRTAFFSALATCRTELDLTIKVILTPAQYAIWVRHRGW